MPNEPTVAIGPSPHLATAGTPPRGSRPSLSSSKDLTPASFTHFGTVSRTERSAPLPPCPAASSPPHPMSLLRSFPPAAFSPPKPPHAPAMRDIHSPAVPHQREAPPRSRSPSAEPPRRPRRPDRRADTRLGGLAKRLLRRYQAHGGGRDLLPGEGVGRAPRVGEQFLWEVVGGRRRVHEGKVGRPGEAGRTKGFLLARNPFCIEPTVRVELTTGGLRNHCSATELRRLEHMMLGVCPAS